MVHNATLKVKINPTIRPNSGLESNVHYDIINMHFTQDKYTHLFQ